MLPNFLRSGVMSPKPQPIEHTVRVLAADTDFYVRHDGNDRNDGSANHPDHAFKTIQGAVDHVRRFIDTGVFHLRINVKSSPVPYAGVRVRGPFRGSGTVSFVCSRAKSSVIVSDRHSCFGAYEHARFSISGGFEIRSLLYGINAELLSIIYYEDVVFAENSGGPHVRSTTRSVVQPLGTSYVIGGAMNLFRSSAGGEIAIDNALHQFDADAHFRNQTIYSSQDSIVFINGSGFVVNGHKITGKRHTCWANGIIQWVMRSVDAIIPGDIDGEELMGGRFWTGLEDTDTSTGNFDYDVAAGPSRVQITGVGFRPRVIDFMAAAEDGDHRASLGWANNRAGTIANASVACGASAQGHIQEQAVQYIQDAENMLSAAVTAVGEDGFTLDWTRTGSPARRILRIKWKAGR